MTTGVLTRNWSGRRLAFLFLRKGAAKEKLPRFCNPPAPKSAPCPGAAWRVGIAGCGKPFLLACWVAPFLLSATNLVVRNQIIMQNPLLPPHIELEAMSWTPEHRQEVAARLESWATALRHLPPTQLWPDGETQPEKSFLNVNRFLN
jgi:hypothetical protein